MVGFPLLLIPLAVFNIIVFLMPGVSMTEPLFRLTLMSGAEWPITLSDMLIALGMLLLLLEVIKGARPGAKYLMDHLLSLLVFGAAAAEFVLWPKFGNSTFFLLALLALVDFLAGIALRVRRRLQYVAVTAPAPSRRAAKRAEAAEEPRVDPGFTPPAPSQPPATPASAAPPPVASWPPSASIAESVLPDPPGPQPAQPNSVAAPSEHSSQLASSELQPGSGTPGLPDKPQR